MTDDSDIINVAMTVEEKRYLMLLLKTTLRSYEYHLVKIKGRYAEKDEIEELSKRAWNIWYKLKAAKTYKEAKQL